MKEKVGEFCSRHREILFWVAIGMALDVAFLMIRNTSLIADEGFHLPQIAGFLKGDFTVSPDITVLPIYHAMMAGILYLIGAQSLVEARLVTFLGSATSILIFHALVRRLWPGETHLRTAQFVFLPILFPMHFLIYTDTWALAFVLLAVERALANRPWQSALSISLAILMRQPNLVWAGMIWIFLVWQPPSLRHSLINLRANWLATSLPFALLFAIFGAFLLFNGGVAMGDKHQHEIGFNLSNIWFFGICFFLLFLPACIGTCVRLLNRWRTNSLWIGASLAAGFFIFQTTYRATHQYNQASLWFYLRNRLIFWTSQGWLAKALSFPFSLVGLLGFVLTPLASRKFSVLVPVSLLSIVVMPLIEQRYYLVPMTLFLAFRKLEERSWELINIVFYVVTSYLVFYGISQRLFFL